MKRSITSYAKVQHLIGNLIRNRRMQLYGDRIRERHYLNVGCGRNPYPDFINIDYLWHPEIDVCWDITRKLPFEDNSMRGVFSEHCLEHFPLQIGYEIMREMHRVLSPGGILRLVLPDGQLYLDLYHSHLSGSSDIAFPYQQYGVFRGIDAPMLHVNRVFYQDRESPYGHCFMYDFDLLKKILEEIGYTQISRERFRTGRDAVLLVDDETRRAESFYVEAVASKN